MDARETPDEALASLWGPTFAESRPTYVYVEGVGSKTTAAGAGIFYGPDAASNRSFVVPGPNFGTADRARLCAIHNTLCITEPTTTLVIFCSSKALIRQLCYSAAKNSSLGWPGPNSDVFKDIVRLLGRRHARTSFVHVDSRSGNHFQKEAYFLAK
ncbi:hypothetical protein C8R46DRAFT_921118, partial [Mycena filopes]